MKKILGQRVLLKEMLEQKEPEETTASGLVIPDTYGKNKGRTLAKGEVVGLGIDCVHTKVGNTVYFDVNTVQKIYLDGEDYLILDENHLFAVES